MYAKKKNPSGVVSVQVIDKSGGKYRVFKTVGSSSDKVLDIAKTITTLKIKLPLIGETMTKTMLITKRHPAIAPLFNPNFWENL
ncbi:MAG: hypothetical protein LBJ17_02210 [Dysgonamonadaceae bacterium]|nr:hypothetical protein [Dysgonamonadaceae bacterium]